MNKRNKQILLITLLAILIALSVYYYGAVYLPSLAQANLLEMTIEAQR